MAPLERCFPTTSCNILTGLDETQHSLRHPVQPVKEKLSGVPTGSLREVRGRGLRRSPEVALGGAPGAGVHRRPERVRGLRVRPGARPGQERRRRAALLEERRRQQLVPLGAQRPVLYAVDGLGQSPDFHQLGQSPQTARPSTSAEVPEVPGVQNTTRVLHRDLDYQMLGLKYHTWDVSLPKDFLYNCTRLCSQPCRHSTNHGPIGF
mmetsp:Transcript_79497/g.233679  ORF Transcript_79497/g.233679 Transcript_79497/m.233679 type:complete len:207 (+) Transcript_79497:606-1226(+)